MGVCVAPHGKEGNLEFGASYYAFGVSTLPYAHTTVTTDRLKGSMRKLNLKFDVCLRLRFY